MHRRDDDLTVTRACTQSVCVLRAASRTGSWFEPPSMRIVVLGCGAIGGYVGGARAHPPPQPSLHIAPSSCNACVCTTTYMHMGAGPGHPSDRHHVPCCGPCGRRSPPSSSCCCVCTTASHYMYLGAGHGHPSNVNRHVSCLLLAIDNRHLVPWLCAPCCCAGMLTKAGGAEVVMVDMWPEHVEHMQRHGSPRWREFCHCTDVTLSIAIETPT